MNFDCSIRVKVPKWNIGNFRLKSKKFLEKRPKSKNRAERDMLRGVIGDQKNYQIIIEKNYRLETTITLPRNVVQQNI
jgi:hypothetical protein